MRTLSLVVAVLALALPNAVHAQEGCDQASPCDLVVDVSDSGFTDVSVSNFTLNDWYTIDASNGGETPHTLTIEGYGVSMALGLDESKTQTIQFSKLGCFDLKDSPSGAVHKLRVVTSDSIDFSQHVAAEKDPCTGLPVGPTSSSSGKMPGLELPLLALAIVGVVAWRRRA
ncbi:MAG: hypothetical protein V4510_01195 [bacterium]